MAPPTTALLLIDPYNDFLHPKGKANPALAESLHHTQTIPHLLSLVKTVRNAQIPIFYCLHQQSHPDQYKDWQFMTKSQQGLEKRKVFEEGSWGAQIFEGLEPDPKNSDVMVAKHWNSSSFHNTDLDYQLKQRGITHVVLAGLVANTCIESTARYAYELGFKITMISDATAGFSTAAKDAGVELIWPLFVNRVMTTSEYAASLSETSSQL